ncbi:MAG: ATP-binding cassette domain-containing protein [Dongiaceae bacterium]
MTSSGLVLDQVSITLGERLLVPPLSLVIKPGEAATVMGPSGSGKSTLLALLCGTVDPIFHPGGRAWLNGVALFDLPPERRRVGILFQDDLLFPHMTVGENLAFGLPRSIRGRAERGRRIEAALAEAGLPGSAGRQPGTLSGGQRARVALLRALLSEPRALLLDEPFGRLDAGLRQRFRQFVFEHTRRRGLPTLLVTHEMADADAAGGQVVTIGTVEEAAASDPDQLSSLFVLKPDRPVGNS